MFKVFFLIFSCFLFVVASCQSDSLIIKLLPYPNYNYKWRSYSLNYDVTNSLYGAQVSNGYDEVYLIHFEDISSDWLYKIQGTTDFTSDYSLNGGMIYNGSAFHRLFSLPTLEVSKLWLPSRNFKLEEINFSLGRTIRRIRTYSFIKIGYQELNTFSNFGIGIGLQKTFSNIYVGFIYRNFFDYNCYSLYAQSSFIFKRIGIRALYDNISNNNFFSIGISYLYQIKSEVK
jgi:hypothetical protein